MNPAKEIEHFQKAYEKALDCKWKGGAVSIARHLKRRKKRGHLPESSTEMDLIQKGFEILKSQSSLVYVYLPSKIIYFAVYKKWALFFDEDGLWDTVFPPDVPEQ